MNKHNRKSPSKARQKSAPLHFSNTGKNMTSKAGLIPVVKFLDKLGFGELFRHTVHHERKENALYRLEDGVFLILTGLIGGAMSLSKCAILWSGCQVLQKVAGWSRLPDETTLGRLFKEVGDRQVSEMETFVHVLRRKVWKNTARTGGSEIGLLRTLWIDVNSSVKTPLCQHTCRIISQ